MTTTSATGTTREPPSVLHANPPVVHVPDATYSTAATGVVQPLGGATVFVPTIVIEAPDPDDDAVGDYLFQYVVDPDIDPAGGTAGVITGYLTPANVRGSVRSIFFRNTSGSSRNVSLWLTDVPVVLTEAIAAGAKLQLDSMWVLWPADTIKYQASGAGVGLYISGVKEVTDST